MPANTLSFIIGFIAGFFASMGILVIVLFVFMDVRALLSQFKAVLDERGVLRIPKDGMVLEPMSDEDERKLDTVEWNPLRKRLQDSESEL